MDDKFDKQKTLDFMRAEFAFVQRTLDVMSPEQMHVPDVQGFWSVKDTIAHLSAWHNRTLNWLATARRGEVPVTPEEGYSWEEIDRLNDERYMVDRDRPLNEVLREFQATYERLYTEAEALTEEELFTKAGLSMYFRDPLFGYIAYNTFFHYRTHLEPIRAWLNEISRRQTMETPAVREDE